MSTDNNTFFKILVAIDGSEKSMKAAEYAIDIAINQKANVQLIAVTVIELLKLNLSTFVAAPTFGLEDLEATRCFVLLCALCSLRFGFLLRRRHSSLRSTL